MSKSSTFNPVWLTNPEFKGWLASVPDNPHAAFCKPCHKLIALSNMGKRSLTSHMASTKHKLVTGDGNPKIQSFFTKPKPSVSSCSADSSVTKVTDSSASEHVDVTEENTCDAAICGPSLDLNWSVASTSSTEGQKTGGIDRYVETKDSRRAEIL